MNDMTVYKDNQLIEASYKLTLAEQRLMLYCIAKLNPTNPEKEQKIYVDDYLKQFPGVDKKSVYAQIKKSIDDLGERWIRVKKPKYIEEFRWIQYKKYSKDEGYAVIKFSDDVMPYLCQLEQQFTKYKLRNVSAFKRTYSIRLYEILTQYRKLKKRTIIIVELRELLQLNGKFSQIKDFKKYVIDPAVKEINDKSDLIISYTQIKQGRTVYSFEFSIQVTPEVEAHERQVNGLKQIAEIKRKINNKN